MRVEYPPLCGRDHLAYRSFYFPIKVCYNFVSPSARFFILQFCIKVGTFVIALNWFRFFFFFFFLAVS